MKILARVPVWTCSYCGRDFENPQAFGGHVTSAHVRIHRERPTRHGTRGGYYKHLAKGERPCEECTAANTRYMKAYRESLRREDGRATA